MKYFIMLLLMLGTSISHAHEMVPTYPKLKQSHVSGILVTTMELFNKRADVEYYEIGVFDKEWKEVPFVSSYEVVRLKYLDHLTFDVYINQNDQDRVEYLCTKSMVMKDDVTKTAVSSRICSRFKD